MWLATGTFPPSDFILEQVNKFLRTARRRWLAKDCIERLQKTMRRGCRLYPPNLVEVETIKFKMTKILNTVYYPNDTEGFFEVDSGTKVKDFELAIMERLELQPCEEFKLFAKIGDTVVNLPPDMFFYDYMRHDHLALQSKPPRTETDPDEIYQMVALIFMRKTWSKMVPGHDPKADAIFHYHQEVPKFLRGWHKSTKEDATRMAGLICRAKVADNKKFGEVSETNMPPLNELIPRDKYGNMLEKEWKKQIFAAYRDNNDGEKTSSEAKAEFLNIIFQWPAFGSAFVDVKQKAFPSLPQTLLGALNKNGLNFIDPETREIVKNYPFSQILKCRGDQGFFEIAVKGDPKKSALRFETELGYKVADLIVSYKEIETPREPAEL
ncbi:unconventional myosin-VIIa-like [Amphiura filiformis]|uniref:unconventional myosin-VIIa-like n=1 Tax=Amphiura filiformis TaxID=82378 RepID=UPI003B222E0E